VAKLESIVASKEFEMAVAAANLNPLSFARAAFGGSTELMLAEKAFAFFTTNPLTLIPSMVIPVIIGIATKQKVLYKWTGLSGMVKTNPVLLMAVTTRSGVPLNRLVWHSMSRYFPWYGITPPTKQETGGSKSKRNVRVKVYSYPTGLGLLNTKRYPRGEGGKPRIQNRLDAILAERWGRRGTVELRGRTWIDLGGHARPGSRKPHKTTMETFQIIDAWMRYANRVNFNGKSGNTEGIAVRQKQIDDIYTGKIFTAGSFRGLVDGQLPDGKFITFQGGKEYKGGPRTIYNRTIEPTPSTKGNRENLIPYEYVENGIYKINMMDAERQTLLKRVVHKIPALKFAINKPKTTGSKMPKRALTYAARPRLSDFPLRSSSQIDKYRQREDYFRFWLKEARAQQGRNAKAKRRFLDIQYSLKNTEYVLRKLRRKAPIGATNSLLNQIRNFEISIELWQLRIWDPKLSAASKQKQRDKIANTKKRILDIRSKIRTAKIPKISKPKPPAPVFEISTRAVYPRPVTRAAAPRPVTRAAAPRLVTRAAAPQLVTRAAAPQLVTRAAAPQPVTRAQAQTGGALVLGAVVIRGILIFSR